MELERGDERQEKSQWKFEQLKRLYEIKNDLLGQPEAEEDCLRVAQKCGLLPEFKQYLSDLNQTERK